MSGVRQRVVAGSPVAALFAVVAGLGQAIAVLAGYAPAPGGAAIALGIAAAAVLGWGAAALIRASYVALVGLDRPAIQPPAPPPAPPSPQATATPARTAPMAAEPTTPAVPRPRTVEERLAARRAAGRMATTTTVDTVPAGRSATAHSPDPVDDTPVSGEARPGAQSRHRRRATARRPAAPPPSLLRTGIVAGAVLVLAIVCWIRPGEPGRVLFGLASAVVGLAVYALPVVPVLSLVPAGRRVPVPWSALTRAGRTAADLRALGGALLGNGRDAMLGRAAGLVLATVALFHLMRGEPGLEAGAYRLAGGLLGMLVATPLAGAFSVAGAYGLLLAVLVSVALVTAGHLHGQVGRYPTIAALVLMIVAPLAAAGVSNRVGYEFYLGVAGDRVVVIAGLSPNHRHEVFDSTVALADVPEPMRPVLAAGLQVTGKADGLRIAAALVDPAKAAADGFPDGGLVLRTGECFSFIGGTSNFRYQTPCNGEHTGEVFYVGHLPFVTDPGATVRSAAARGICEKAYGSYLGAPFGTSYLPMEPPVLRPGGWVPRPLVACVFGTVGPWPLKGTRTVAALQQPLDWTPASAPGPGCAVQPGLRLIAAQPGLRCVAPGTGVAVAGPAPLAIDAEFAPIGKAAANARVGVACVGADAATGYHATVGGDGVLTVVKQDGATRTLLGAGGRAKSATSPSPQTAATQVQLTCRPVGAGVQVVANAGKNRQVTLTDPAGITSLSPRLVVESVEAPVIATVTLFTAVVAA